MKKAAFLLAFLLTVSAGFSQQRKRMAKKADHMTLKQRTTLAVKKLTLTLDLSSDQAKKITSLYTKMGKQKMEKMKKVKAKNAQTREKIAKIKKASKDKADFKMRVQKAVKKGELKKEDLGKMRRRRGGDFDSKNQALDHMIAFQNSMKKILTKEQYQKFKKLKMHRAKTAKHKVKKHKKMKREKREH